MTATATAVSTLRTFSIDPAHSAVTFQVRHLVTKVRGSFADFQGAIQFDADSPDQSSIVFSINTASIDTQSADRDQHLRSQDFFAVEQYPEITFVSTQVTRRGEQRFDVAGTLTIRGVAKAVVLPVDYLGEMKDPWGNAKAGFETEITINRKDFGLTWNAALETGGFLVGDDVKIQVSVQALAA